MLTVTGGSSRRAQYKSKIWKRGADVGSAEGWANMPFRYYIHDEAVAFRMELVGPLTEIHLEELRGCWRTAKSIVGERKLIIDVRRFEPADQDSREWVSEMRSAGAVF